MSPRTIRLLGALAAIASTASSAQAASVKEIFEKHDLLGTFAWDCSKPPSAENNWHYINRLVDIDHVQRDFMTGPATRQWVTVFDKASEPKPNEVVASGRITGASPAGRSKTRPSRVSGASNKIGYSNGRPRLRASRSSRTAG
jgi:hypothetical protein